MNNTLAAFCGRWKGTRLDSATFAAESKKLDWKDHYPVVDPQGHLTGELYSLRPDDGCGPATLVDYKVGYGLVEGNDAALYGTLP